MNEQAAIYYHYSFTLFMYSLLIYFDLFIFIYEHHIHFSIYTYTLHVNQVRNKVVVILPAAIPRIETQSAALTSEGQVMIQTSIPRRSGSAEASSRRPLIAGRTEHYLLQNRSLHNRVNQSWQLQLPRAKMGHKAVKHRGVW